MSRIGISDRPIQPTSNPNSLQMQEYEFRIGSVGVCNFLLTLSLVTLLEFSLLP